VVILDEPDSGVDIASIDLILDAIHMMKKGA
jgi:Fe-S cluster assembly ATPase SufC